MKTMMMTQMNGLATEQLASPARAPRIRAEFATALRCDSYDRTTWGTTATTYVATANVNPEFVYTVEPSGISVANLEAKPHNQRPEEKYS